MKCAPGKKCFDCPECMGVICNKQMVEEAVYDWKMVNGKMEKVYGEGK